ncbi:MAG: DUF2851 family protein [Chloroflexia bacterium]|nr:DUF2851 family protein [Chloroflexia bacterium]
MATDPPEIAVSLAWHLGKLPASFETTDGRRVEVIHRGAWSHGLGPDFADAMLLFDGREVRTGAVEIHVAARGWTDHGHHLDPRYQTVVLHVVLRDDGVVARRADGAVVPVAVVDRRLLDGLELTGWTAATWDRFGGTVCAADLAATDPAVLREAIFGLGDSRLAARAARIEARLTSLPPSEVLWTELLDGLGFSANREPMRTLAAALPIALLEERLAAALSADRLPLARGLLFGVAGFLPLAPADASFAGFEPGSVALAETAWANAGGAWLGSTLPPTAWTRARVRPANHPAVRLAAAARMVVNALPRGGLLGALLDPLHDGGDPAAVLSDLATPPGVGPDRALDIVASGLIPFALALGSQSGDRSLSDAASLAWERLPGSGGNVVTRRALRQVAGEAGLGRLGARGQQGLQHLDTALCGPRRCYECPIAHAVVRHRDTML